MNRMRMA